MAKICVKAGRQTKQFVAHKSIFEHDPWDIKSVEKVMKVILET